MGLGIDQQLTDSGHHDFFSSSSSFEVEGTDEENVLECTAASFLAVSPG